ncbi:hypothetical protein BC938DRAFT_480982 [Jimgerdemannia flammicorona]|uniref:Uncharacterized protein n=1 Tax=Jimgerdemannia flammicorona TaxID=994334 RepID=A0A433QH62_9FUNG|nr:hypothetical protein BC938DRAFT_480982 [Jimgerdemannia flammicorona]
MDMFTFPYRKKEKKKKKKKPPSPHRDSPPSLPSTHAPQQLQNCQHNIIHIAKSGCLGLLGVMQAAGPVDGDVCLATVDLVGGTDGATGGNRAELKKTFKYRAVLAHIDY